VDSFDSDMDIFLEDSQEDLQINLRETPEYTFMANADELTNRFSIHFLKSTGINEYAGIEGVTVYSSGKSIYIASESLKNLKVELYNTMGQLLTSKQMSVSGLTHFDVAVSTGWYVVKLKTNEGFMSEKVFID
jgi:hypothetical protein